jgi:hypothetical protein
MAIKIQGVTIIDDDRIVLLKAGTTAERPDPAEAGMLRFNTDIAKVEFYSGEEWISAGEDEYARTIATLGL